MPGTVSIRRNLSAVLPRPLPFQLELEYPDLLPGEQVALTFVLPEPFDYASLPSKLHTFTVQNPLKGSSLK